jgi:hypothetical protein
MGDLESGLSRAARRVSPIVAARYLMAFYFVLLMIPCIVFAVRLRNSMKKLSEEDGQYSHEDSMIRLLTDDAVSLPKTFMLLFWYLLKGRERFHLSFDGIVVCADSLWHSMLADTSFSQQPWGFVRSSPSLWLLPSIAYTYTTTILIFGGSASAFSERSVALNPFTAGSAKLNEMSGSTTLTI